MRLTTYLIKKMLGKLPNQRKTGKPEANGEALLGSAFGKQWGELDRDVTIDRRVEKVDEKTGGGWILNVNNYTKCDVPSHVSWSMDIYQDKDNGELFVRAQTKEEIYFLFWKVSTLYSFDTWLWLPGGYFSGTDCQQKVRTVYDFVDHGSMASHGTPTVNSRIYIDRKNPKYKIQLGEAVTIQGSGRNDSDFIIVNF